jgi:hypothetical protein
MSPTEPADATAPSLDPEVDMVYPRILVDYDKQPERAR